jgi:hypothetical protein
MMLWKKSHLTGTQPNPGLPDVSSTHIFPSPSHYSRIQCPESVYMFKHATMDPLKQSHLENIQCQLQFCITFLQQGAHFTLAEKLLEFVCPLLGIDKGVNFVKCSRQSYE